MVVHSAQEAGTEESRIDGQLELLSEIVSKTMDLIKTTETLLRKGGRLHI